MGAPTAIKLRRLGSAPTTLIVLLVLLAAGLVGCGGSDGSPVEPEAEPPERPAAEPSERPGSETTPIEVSDVATDLEIPWGIDFLPNGDALVSERASGRLLQISEAGEVEEVQTLPSEANGEGGLLGVAVSPDYERDGFVYAYYTTSEDNRIARFELGSEPEPILTGIAASSIHNGGRLRFGPDGMLYASTGDAADPDSSQDPDSLNGKILRIDPEGDAPDDNPDPGSPVYSLGHRNVQGLAWDAEGQLYASEFGEGNLDEVNRIEPGANYGWPAFEGGGGEPEFVDPITTWPVGEASPSGAEILVDSAIPQWEGEMFVAALRGERLWRLELPRSGQIEQRSELYGGEFGRIRTAVQAPDGSLWIATSNRDGRGSPAPGDDRIIRLGD